jgi:hypothetical protein
VEAGVEQDQGAQVLPPKLGVEAGVEQDQGVQAGRADSNGAPGLQSTADGLSNILTRLYSQCQCTYSRQASCYLEIIWGKLDFRIVDIEDH